MASNGRNPYSLRPHRKQPSRNEPCPCDSGAKYKRCCLGKSQLERQWEDDPEFEFDPRDDPSRAPVQRSSAALLDRCGKQLDFVPSLQAEGGELHFQELLALADSDREEQLEVRLTTLFSWDLSTRADPADPTSWRLDPDATVIETSIRTHSTPEAQEEALKRLIALAESEEAIASGFIHSDQISYSK